MTFATHTIPIVRHTTYCSNYRTYIAILWPRGLLVKGFSVGDSTSLSSSMGNITLLISKNAKTHELNSNTSSTGRKNELSLK